MSDHTSILKRCTKCRKEYPATPEYFRLKKHRGVLILYSQCRDCERAYNAIYDKERSHTPERKAYNTARRNTPQYKAWLKRYRQTPEYLARKKASRHTPQYKAYKKAYRQTQKHKSYMKAYQQTDKYKRYLKAYREDTTNLLSRRILQGRRRTRQMALPNHFSDADWQNALSYFGGCCAVCGKPSGLWHKMAMDHWIPLSSPNCPGTIPTNILPLCHGMDGCNNSKKDRDPVVWLTDRYGPRKAKQILKRIQAYFDSLKEGDHANR